MLNKFVFLLSFLFIFNVYSADCFDMQTENISKGYNLEFNTFYTDNNNKVYQTVSFFDNENHYDDRIEGSVINELLVTFSNFSQQRYSEIDNFCAGNSQRLSVHYRITKNYINLDAGQIIQIVPDEKRAWAYLGKNNNSISVMFDSVKYYPLENKQIKSFSSLFKYLNDTYHFNLVILDPKDVFFRRLNKKERLLDKKSLVKAIVTSAPQIKILSPVEHECPTFENINLNCVSRN